MNHANHPRSIQSVSRSSQTLGSLLRLAVELQLLEKIVSAYLPEEYSSSCSLASFEQGSLLLICENSVTATALRLEANNLKRQLTKHPEFRELKALRFKIGRIPAPPEPQVVQRKLSREASVQIRATAENLPDSQLKESLLRLASRTRNEER